MLSTWQRRKLYPPVKFFMLFQGREARQVANALRQCEMCRRRDRRKCSHVSVFSLKIIPKLEIRFGAETIRQDIRTGQTESIRRQR